MGPECSANTYTRLPTLRHERVINSTMTPEMNGSVTFVHVLTTGPIERVECGCAKVNNGKERRM